MEILTIISLAALAGAAAVVLWPGRGLWPRLRRLRQEGERVRVEDALKHLHQCERSGRPCTVESVAGRLEVPRGEASEVLTRLVERGLAAAVRDGFGLTEAGSRYALRVLRTHRLWERYLADRTGVPAEEWHAEAERVEHELSDAEVEALSARLGHPRYDPHGDPIPTLAGEMPAPAGESLRRVAPGSRVRVVHVEDEPREVYEGLARLGLAPGLPLEVLEASGSAPGSVRVRLRGRVVALRAVEADNVTVEALPAGAEVPGRRRTLRDAEVGETVRVTAIVPACQGPQRRRLLDLGVVPGTRITPELVSTSGDPVAYRIRGALIALRGEQAAWIEVEGASEEEPVAMERAS